MTTFGDHISFCYRVGEKDIDNVEVLMVAACTFFSEYTSAEIEVGSQLKTWHLYCLACTVYIH